jgi:sugar phosphate isomerase/epimerase
MKQSIGICSWSLNNNLSLVQQTMLDAGVSHLHLEVAAIDAFREAIAQNGWAISCTMVGFPQEDYSTLESIRETGGIMPDDCWAANRAIVLDALVKTAEAGVGLLSFHAGFIDHNDAEGYQKFCVRIKELADAALEKEVVLLMETGQETAQDLRSCLEELDHPALGVNFDPANMILYGKGDPIEAVKTLAPWIKHVHVKDATASSVSGEWGAEVPWGDGEVDGEIFLQTLGEIGFSGTLAIEREAGDARADDIELAVKRVGDLA